MNASSTKPYDARLAAWLVTPLIETPITPNHLTFVRFVVGIAGAVMFGLGDHPVAAALLVILSNFLDHTDGELARMSGKTSRFGHYFDLASDALVTVGMFLGIGIGLVDALGERAAWMGGLAGLAVAGIFHLRNLIENRHGKIATRQPRFRGFEAEDVLYLVPLVTLLGGLQGFLHAAAIGAPLAFLIVLVQYVAIERRSRDA
ncbi:MAG: CDP-alcohol phosphatidyltransferase family protein [Gammaproteobacteria bacterium]